MFFFENKVKGEYTLYIQISPEVFTVFGWYVFGGPLVIPFEEVGGVWMSRGCLDVFRRWIVCCKLG